MMYIEPSHLERNQDILRRHLPSGVEAILLAHVQEAAAAAPRIQLESPTLRENNSGSAIAYRNNNGIAATNCARNFAERIGNASHHKNNNDKQHYYSDESGERCKKVISPVGNYVGSGAANILNGIKHIAPANDRPPLAHEAKQARLDVQQDEEENGNNEFEPVAQLKRLARQASAAGEEAEEEYELFDVDFGPVVLNGQRELQHTPLNEEHPVDTSTNEYTFEIHQGAQGDFEYIVVPKTIAATTSERKPPPPLKQIVSHGGAAGVRLRTQRPVPDAIPISQVRFNRAKPQQQQVPDHFIPNGWHSNNNENEEEQQENGDYDDGNFGTSFSRHDDSTFSVHQRTRHAAADPRRAAPECGEPRREAYNHPEYAPLHEETLGQMGLLSKLRQLLTFSNTANDNTQENRNKRKLGNRAVSGPQPFKYQKIDHSFPDIAVSSWEDDAHLMYAPFMHKQENCLPNYHAHNKNNLQFRTGGLFPNVGVQQRKSFNNMSGPKLRKSLFAAPDQTHRLVKNSLYGEFDFSDDDDDDDACVLTEPSIRPHRFGVGGSVMAPSSALHRGTRGPIAAPPPLMDARHRPSGGANAYANVRPLELGVAHRPTYADVLKPNGPAMASGASSRFFFNNAGDGPGNAFSCSSGSSSCTSGKYGGFGQLSSSHNPWTENANSILVQQKESLEREKYRQLLETVMPRLYGPRSDQPQNSSGIAGLFRQQQQQRPGSSAAATLDAAITANEKSPGSLVAYQRMLKRPPLSSSVINLEANETDSVRSPRNRASTSAVAAAAAAPVVIDVDEIDDDDDITEIVDLDEVDENNRRYKDSDESIRRQVKPQWAQQKQNKVNANALPYVEPVNSLQERFNTSPHLKDNWLASWQSNWKKKRQSKSQEVAKVLKITEERTNERLEAESDIRERLRKFQLIDPELIVIDDFPEPTAAEEEPEVFEFTADQQARIKAAICGPPDQVLVSKFSLNITRRDVHTLLGHSWLNDEVINFYMNLLTERGEKKSETHNLPRVYAMNTFFVPRLLQAGHGGVKRWTRKVDIFSKDVIPVPVHVGGVHWCMAIIHLKNRTIKYYDSMGTPNPNVLRALEQYLKDESMDKRKQPFDTSQFEVESVRDVPRQMNGSDCGVFSCMFAEYITRNRPITFTQQNMEYFRHKMILEIVQGELLR